MNLTFWILKSLFNFQVKIWIPTQWLPCANIRRSMVKRGQFWCFSNMDCGKKNAKMKFYSDFYTTLDSLKKHQILVTSLIRANLLFLVLLFTFKNIFLWTSVNKQSLLTRIAEVIILIVDNINLTVYLDVMCNLQR